MPRATNISALEAQEIKQLPPNTVLISINNTFRDHFPLQLDRLSSKVLTVAFDDVTVDMDTDTGIKRKAIDIKTVYEILNFINIHNGKNFIVHCHAGVSRSAAICLYLHLTYGYELKKGFWENSNDKRWPNPFVLGRLMVERNRK